MSTTVLTGSHWAIAVQAHTSRHARDPIATSFIEVSFRLPFVSGDETQRTRNTRPPDRTNTFGRCKLHTVIINRLSTGACSPDYLPTTTCLVHGRYRPQPNWIRPCACRLAGAAGAALSQRAR